VKVKQIETQDLKNEAQRDLEEVLPALQAAERALNALNKNDIIEIKTFTKPPFLVQLTLEGVCCLLQEKPDWDTAKKVLGEANFIKRLVEYDRDNVTEKVSKSLRRIIEDPTFTPDQASVNLNLNLNQAI
jgi:dynein heavy chain